MTTRQPITNRLGFQAGLHQHLSCWQVVGDQGRWLHVQRSGWGGLRRFDKQLQVSRGFTLRENGCHQSTQTKWRDVDDQQVGSLFNFSHTTFWRLVWKCSRIQSPFKYEIFNVIFVKNTTALLTSPDNKPGSLLRLTTFSSKWRISTRAPMAKPTSSAYFYTTSPESSGLRASPCNPSQSSTLDRGFGHSTLLCWLLYHGSLYGSSRPPVPTPE